MFITIIGQAGRFFYKPTSEQIALLQSGRHDKGKRSIEIKGGYHLSYFKSSIISKVNNSHGLRYFKIKLFLALFGIDPFFRKDKSYKNLFKDKSLNHFKKLDYSWIDFRKLVFK